MTFNEATLEAAIMELMEQQGYTHKLGEQLHKNFAEAGLRNFHFNSKYIL